MGPQAQFAWDALEFRTPAMLRVVDGLAEDALRWRPPGGSNSVGWLLWHVAEVEDNWVRDKLCGLPKRYPFGAGVRATPSDAMPGKAALLAYFHEVRALSRGRLAATGEPEFDRVIEDEAFGRLTVRQVWAGVATSGAWHGGQIALTARLVAAGPGGTT
ncbi:MAG TPA: DinB family protein [Tepidisphaeraceae bacterium]|nr:DinB family protein [Tepidisphaeraceae bacterium]